MTVLTAVFQCELRAQGVACTLLPGGSEVCAADPHARVVYLGADLDADSQAMIGLHELGHLSVHCHFFMQPKTQDLKYAEELAAWDWAARLLPPGYERLLEQWRLFGLSSYYRRDE